MTTATATPLTTSDAIWEMDRRHILHPWTQFGPFERDGSLVFDRGQGCWLWDTAGKRYFDAVGGMWCTNIGLGRAEMAQAIADQAQRLAFSNTFVDASNVPSAQLAAKLASLAPGDLNRVHFTTCGSTAVDSAFRMVQFYHRAKGNLDKVQIIARDMSYHGSTYIGQSLGRRPGDRVPEFLYKEAGIHHLTPPNPYRAPDGMDEAAFTDFLVAEFQAKVDDLGVDRVGAFIAEPIQASGGVIVPPKEYLRRIWQICQQHDILFIADEVVTAFGRLGHWFASDAEYGVTPDIITCAKGLTSGYLPLGAVIFSDRVWQAMASEGDRWFTSGFTYSGHPVSCAAALKNLEIIEREALLGNAAEVGDYFLDRLMALQDLPLIGQVRGRRLMVCVESVASKDTKEPLPEAANEAKRIADACEAMGLMVRPMGHLNVMSPPLIMTRDDADFVAETLHKAICQVTDQLTKEGWRIG